MNRSLHFEIQELSEAQKTALRNLSNKFPHLGQQFEQFLIEFYQLDKFMNEFSEMPIVIISEFYERWSTFINSIINKYGQTSEEARTSSKLLILTCMKGIDNFCMCIANSPTHKTLRDFLIRSNGQVAFNLCLKICKSLEDHYSISDANKEFFESLKTSLMMAKTRLLV